LQYNTDFLPFATAIPVPEAVFKVIAKPPVVLFETKYSFETAGQIMLVAPLGVPVTFKNIFRASFGADPSPLVRVRSVVPAGKTMLDVPATASSTRVVIPVLTSDPQLVSPSAGRVSLRLEV
jgi:hypothetical protein